MFQFFDVIFMKKGVKTPVNSCPETEYALKIFALPSSSVDIPAADGMPDCGPTAGRTGFSVSSAQCPAGFACPLHMPLCQTCEMSSQILRQRWHTTTPSPLSSSWWLSTRSFASSYETSCFLAADDILSSRFIFTTAFCIQTVSDRMGKTLIRFARPCTAKKAAHRHFRQNGRFTPKQAGIRTRKP